MDLYMVEMHYKKAKSDLAFLKVGYTNMMYSNDTKMGRLDHLKLSAPDWEFYPGERIIHLSHPRYDVAVLVTKVFEQIWHDLFPCIPRLCDPLEVSFEGVKRFNGMTELIIPVEYGYQAAELVEIWDVRFRKFVESSFPIVAEDVLGCMGRFQSQIRKAKVANYAATIGDTAEYRRIIVDVLQISVSPRRKV